MGIYLSIQPDDKNTEKVQRSISVIEKSGGGKLILEKGIHYSKPLRLVSNLDFILEKGAQLRFIDDPSEYPIVWTRWEGTECHAIQPMIFAENCQNINISGEGIIDGQGQKWWTWYRQIRNGENPAVIADIRNKLADLNKSIKAGSGGGGVETHFLRPPLIQFKKCHQMSIKGICVQNSAFWNTHILYCTDVSITGVHFKNPGDSPNTDGLDIDSSQNITVSKCFIDVGDDCVCIKSGTDEDGRRIGMPSKSIKITDCIMEKGHGGVVFGSDSAGGIKDIQVKNCLMNGTDRGIRFKTRRGRGGTIEDILIDSITMKNVLCPIVVNMFYRCGLSEDELKNLSSTSPFEITEATPVIKNIKISNIKADNVKASAAYFCGLPENPLTGIQLENVRISMADNLERQEPAMDMFFTRVSGTGILNKFTENLDMRAVSITDQQGRDIPVKVDF